MSFVKYKNLICLVAAIVLLLILNYVAIGIFKRNADNNAGMVMPSGSDVSQSDSVSNALISRSDTTATVSTTDATTVTTTTTAATQPTKIRFAKGFRYSIVVYLKSQSVAVYSKKSDGKTVKQVKCFTCSSGMDSSPTPTGDFSIIGKHRWRSLQGDVFGQYCSRIHGHILFHSTPYLKEKESSLDDAEYDKLGTPVSHGCIRMSVSDCKWIYDNAPLGTPVSIVDEVGPAGATPVSRNPDKTFSGWDPTDKWAKKNPYLKKGTTSATKTETTKTTTGKTKGTTRTAKTTGKTTDTTGTAKTTGKTKGTTGSATTSSVSSKKIR